MFGWSLPPGCSDADIEAACDSGVRWRCECGGFLRNEPDEVREIETTGEADDFDDRTGEWVRRTYPVTIREEVRRCRRCGENNVSQDL